MPNDEQPTIPPKNLKELAFKRHGDAIEQILTKAENQKEQQAVHELLQCIRKHMGAQRILARDLLNEEHE